MAKLLTQKVLFKGIPASTLYNIYLDSKKHGAAIGALVSIQKKEGAKFSSHGKYITGKNFQLLKDKLIVQSWRGSDWSKSDPDSTLILRFEQNGADTVLNMVHANVPDKYSDGIKKGWDTYYWKPWKKYLATQKKK